MKTTITSVLGLASALLLALCVQAESPSLALVALGSEDNPQLCVGVQISTQHVLVHSTCATNKGPLTMAHVLDISTTSSSNSTETTTLQAALGHSIAIANSTIIPAANGSTPAQSVHVLALEDPLLSDTSYPATLPLKTPYPSYLTVNENTTMISIDMATLRVSLVHGTIFVDDSSCDQPACALPLEVEEREAFNQPTQWSFLLTQSGDGASFRLLGIGGGPVTDRNGVWGFEWLPQALATSSFPEHGVYGVNTVLAVSKEIYGGKDVKTTSEYTEFIVGLRETVDGPMLCAGALIAPGWVLTAAGCARTSPVWVAIDTLPTRGKATEIIAIKRMIPHPNVSSHMLNFMLVRLTRASSRRPIKYNQSKDNTPVSAMATAFGYGATSYHTSKLNDRLRSNKVEVLGAEYCPKSLWDRISKENMCVKKQLCYGDFGGPVITDAWSSKRELFGIISYEFYCLGANYYNVVGRVSAVAKWIDAVIQYTSD
ncbi:hypothetical protein Poli38472_011495 [Pythium oligandrum]|uniref:trypsin n=1 Tax=Pythium oligandrum TaxID=41045 RepID=A0A8K1CJW9_PYTOL|nr:hypothetical protein Poli38472_011495 [Pythium oligandrum]|eukprot:TMW64615.1 hypothetical protein Poli38472_011495 [Pythium oligandrum]